MKRITFKRELLIDALTFGGMYAGANRLMPVLDNILVKTDGRENVVMSSTCLDLGTSVTLNATVETDEIGGFGFCIDPKTLKNIVGTLSCEQVSLEPQTNSCVVRYPNGSASLPAPDCKEFPDTEIADMDKMFQLESATISYILNTSKPFIGNDELRPTMKTVFMKGVGEGLEFCATDAHRMVCDIVGIGTQSDALGENGFMLPKSAIPAMLLASKDSSVCTFYSNSASMVVDFGGKKVFFTKPSGKYPNYHAILDGVVDNTNRCEVMCADFKGAIIRASMCASNTTKTVVITTGEEAKVSAEDVDFGRKSEEVVSVSSFDGGGVQFGMNAAFLHECIDSIEDDTVTICTKSPNKAVTFFDKKHPKKTTLLMPVMLSN